MGTITALVSAYHAEDFIEGRITNLKAQRPSPEIVVVAQANSKEAAIASMWQDVVLLRTVEVPTIYAAWNYAIEASTGEYLVVANCDDRFYTGALKVLSSVLDENPEIALCYADDDISREVGGYPYNRHLWLEGGFETLSKACFVGPMPMWRKSMHKKHGLFDEEMFSAGDYEFWLRLASHGEQFKHIPRAIGVYASRNDSAERREPLRTVWETSRARSRYTIKL